MFDSNLMFLYKVVALCASALAPQKRTLIGKVMDGP
jgi:hypothetical protein